MEGIYDLCKHCDHFVEDGIHLCDERHHVPDDYHAAEPRGVPLTLEQWKLARPDLFAEHSDGLIGPNSEFHHTLLDHQVDWEVVQ